jgi:Peptidase S24-like
MPEPSLYAVPGGVHSLSGPELRELLRSVLARGVAFRFRARGFSMHPFIRDGDVVTVSPGGLEGVRVGAVLAFAGPVNGKLTVHRVVARRDGGYLMRGDNAEVTDGWVAAADVFGRVSRVERAGRALRIGLGPEGRLIALRCAPRAVALVRRALRRVIAAPAGRGMP